MSPSSGVGAPFLLFLLFLGLKLCNVIDWSWWWVTCPLWAPMLLAITIILAVAICVGIGAWLFPGRKRGNG